MSLRTANLPTASVVIRTLNEARHLPDLLRAIGDQQDVGAEVEVVVIDSGSTDGTVPIAEAAGCTMLSIHRHEFSFGRALNRGCAGSRGDYLVFISGHCVPTGKHWLRDLLAPIFSGAAVYSYGRQLPGKSTSFSEAQIFSKYFPAQSQLPQEGFYCNNANAALTRKEWQLSPFDEELAGLEDLHTAQRLHSQGKSIAYVAEAAVLHLHDESFGQVRNRFEREAIAMQRILPHMHFTFFDLFLCIVVAICLDVTRAVRTRCLMDAFGSIILYRVGQYWGTFRGGKRHRSMSAEMKLRYYYPHLVSHEPIGRLAYSPTPIARESSGE